MYQAKLSHVLLGVRDLDRAVAFYTRFLNLRLVERVEDHHAFLSGSDAHHEIALLNVGPDAPQPPPDSVGLNHLAFQVPDRKAFARAFKALAEAGLPVTTVDNRISYSLYFHDPDGNGIEIFYDIRHEPYGQPLWQGIRQPLAAETILAALDEDEASQE